MMSTKKGGNDIKMPRADRKNGQPSIFAVRQAMKKALKATFRAWNGRIVHT